MNISQTENSKKLLNNIINKNFDLNINKKLLDIFNNINININLNDLKLLHTTFLPKLHTKDDYPLLYLHYLKINNIKSINNYYDMPIFYNKLIKNELKQEDLYKEKSDILDIINNPIKERIKLHENIYNNDFVTLDIQHISESTDIKYYEYKFKNHKIFIYELENKININFIITILNFLESIAIKFNKKIYPIDLIIINTNKLKKITNTILLGPENINSGATYPTKNIFIWRNEELYKVLIHELIHFYKFDDDIYYQSEINKTNYTYCINGSIIDRYNEAYTETFAVLIHNYLISKIKNIDYNKLLENEINFSLFQCKKILNFYNITNFIELINKNNNKCILQNTSVFSYFFYKTALLLNLEKFTKILIEDNLNNFKKILDKSINLLINNLDNLNNINFDNNSNFINLTMRMTINEYS